MGQEKNVDCDADFKESEVKVSDKPCEDVFEKDDIPSTDTVEKPDLPDANFNGIVKKHKCTYSGCTAIFLRPYRLVRHMRSHTGERPYKCSHPGCEKTYTNACHLKRHLHSHNVTKTLYQCSQCSLSISNRHNLKRHYARVHGDHGKLTCKECNLTFTKKHQLVTHIASHSPTVYTCEKCNRSYTNLTQYKKHVSTHTTGRKQYPCTASGCTEVFQKWALYHAHLKTQHVIDYKCSICDKVFLQKQHLKTHAQVHEENRPVIACPHEKCHRVYYNKRNLDVHIRVFHLEQKFECDICKVKLSAKSKLQEHIQKLHILRKRERKTKKSQRRKRKDAGKPKKSIISTLIGINLPPKVEKKILQRKSITECLEEVITMSNK